MGPSPMAVLIKVCCSGYVLRLSFVLVLWSMKLPAASESIRGERTESDPKCFIWTLKVKDWWDKNWNRLTAGMLKGSGCSLSQREEGRVLGWCTDALSHEMIRSATVKTQSLLLPLFTLSRAKLSSSNTWFSWLKDDRGFLHGHSLFLSEQCGETWRH